MITVTQCKQIIGQYLAASGRGGFLLGRVSAANPLAITLENGLQLTTADLYVTDNCIGLSLNLKHTHNSGSVNIEESLHDSIPLRRPLQIGDGVLLISRPESTDGMKYILLDRVQPYIGSRGVTAT